MITTTKICTKCNIEYNSGCFSINNRSKDKLEYMCVLCKSIDNRQSYEKNKATRLKHKKEYRSTHKEKYNLYYTNRRKNDFLFKLERNIRNRFYKWLNNNKKNKRTFEYVNCTKEELVVHLESLFQEGMTWENYGEWHIDHIRPLSLFDPTKEEDMNKAWAKENLQPLWAKENQSKGCKI